MKQIVGVAGYIFRLKKRFFLGAALLRIHPFAVEAAPTGILALLNLLRGFGAISLSPYPLPKWARGVGSAFGAIYLMVPRDE